MFHFYRHWKRFGFNKKPVYRFAVITLLYALINGITAYILPLILEERFISFTIVGIILASSSLFNIVTDVIVGSMRRPPHYLTAIRLTGFFAFLVFISMLFPQRGEMLILAACLWGIYSELYNFARFDFIEAIPEKADHALHFGMLNNSFSFGSVIAPILASSLFFISHQLTVSTGIFFVGSMLIYLAMNQRLKNLPNPVSVVRRRMHALAELKVWRTICKKVFPVFLVFLAVGMAEGTITSFTPIFTRNHDSLQVFGGLIFASFFLPTVLFSGYFGHLADREGEKKYILIGMLLSAVSLLFFGFSREPVSAVILAFLHGVGLSTLAPALLSEESKYIEKHHSRESEIVGESGIFYNIGFVAGTMLAGVLASKIGFGVAYGIFGLFYLITFAAYWLWGPRKRSFLDGVLR
ncbi:MAG: MFS transporter [Patescibacteria group bacterium]|jgi:MFS family permease